MSGSVTQMKVSYNMSAYLGILKSSTVGLLKFNIRLPSKSILNFCMPKLVYLLYVALKNVFLGLPFNIIFSLPCAVKFINPPVIINII